MHILKLLKKNISCPYKYKKQKINYSFYKILFAYTIA